MNRTKFLLSATMGLWLAGLLIATAPALATDNGFEYQAFFGAAIPENRQPCKGILTSVTDDLWGSFVTNYVEAEFDGFTLANASGYWKDDQTGEPVSEDSHVLILVATEVGHEDTDAKLVVLIDAYVDLFCQDSVLVIVTPMAFHFFK